MKNILFRADSSSDIGLGHIMRDLVLAKEFADANITFACIDLKRNINHKIVEAGYNLEILKSNDKKELVKLIKKLNIDLLVIDHYKINYKTEKQIKKESGVKIFVLDDTYEKHYCDTLLNHNISANPKKYKSKVPSFCELRCGSQYTLLREEFYKERNKKYKKSKKYKTIFLAIGGTDHSNINISILKVLKTFTNIRVELITTKANKNLKELKRYSKNKNWINLHVNSTQIAKLMAKSDAAIITPSVTLNEIYFMQLPFIAIKTASNQDDIYQYLKKHKYPTLNKFHKKELKTKIRTLIKAKKSA
ncbi:MAG: UDP-2,4-diacetamido-2,4,6-trideoxy-beta-L-altropyranose hydrolase [Campylobacterota bacterium]|nr:UDP-2,4-diacetamido-2,4,6-trideoxy-beta-L-altropyranose hydrolase [Campylobacterota bacterium]